MSVIRQAFSVILPHSCGICSAKAAADDKVTVRLPEGFHICSRCLSRLVPYDREKRFLTCLSEPYKGDPYPGLVLYMPFEYDETFARAIRGIKFSGRKETALFLGFLLGRTASTDKLTADAIVPVPLSPKRLSERGFNQAEMLCRGASEVLKIPVLPDVLIRTRETKRQADLTDDRERSGNVHGVFTVSSSWDVSGMDIILADDVATTGNTLHEAACALLKEGAASVLCMALCGNRNARNAEPF